MRVLLLALIRFYKRFISPHKGYGCAYRVYSGRASCSTLGYRAIRRHGAWVGLGLLQQRCHKCGVAQRRYAPVYRPPAGQRGDCDPGCGGDGCDLNGCDPGGCDQRDCDLRPRRCRSAFDFLDCCDIDDCGGDDKRRERKRKNRKRDAATHLPPRRTHSESPTRESPRGQDWPDDARR